MKVIYPGSFDPVTYGHLDIIKRCSEKFDDVIIGVLNNVSKKGLFTVEERMNLLKETTSQFKNVEISSFSGLLADFAKDKKCSTMIRGLRAVSDYEYEMQMALVNKKLDPEIETLFMVSRSEYVYLSSSIVKEIALHNGNISSFVPEIVEKEMKNKIRGDF
ncbi:MAG: pantetheine-phosphate adenylyltransferase [Tissierella sp.]|uniref:pantetheine-phosphate adenylyltransferase n=1 Tax=Tissierella sp. TaxID=41274 RepID=UPI003F9C47A0